MVTIKYLFIYYSNPGLPNSILAKFLNKTSYFFLPATVSTYLYISYNLLKKWLYFTYLRKDEINLLIGRVKHHHHIPENKYIYPAFK
jgi:hypothetical protein